jgi:dTDP-glucose 4,6-dehydratase
MLITGGAGFIGSNFVQYLVENRDYQLVVLDKLTYAGDLENLKEVQNEIEFIKGTLPTRPLCPRP